VFRRYGIPPKLLKEATGRQAAPDARALAEALHYGQNLAALDESSRNEQLGKALALLVRKAHDWLNRQPIKVSCDRQNSPASWIASILEKRRGGLEVWLNSTSWERSCSRDIPKSSFQPSEPRRGYSDTPVGRLPSELC
jgi:hypothetical protein